MAASWVVRRLCSSAAEVVTPAKATRWERLKNSKAGVWCRGLLSDYKEACREIVVGAWERPIKASIYLGLLGGTGACVYTNPDSSSFQTSVLDRSNQLGLLSPWIRSGVSDGHVQSLVRLHNAGHLSYISLGVASLTYRTDYDPDCSLYEAQCSNLSVPWRELPQRVLDVGFAGHWWVLDTKMKEYDVNDEEFKHLPAAMATTVPPGVQEVEKNENLHKESWLPLKIEEEEDEDVTAATAGTGNGEGKEESLGEQQTETQQTESETQQTESETQQTESETQQTESETQQTESETESETQQTESETEQTESEMQQTESETQQTESEMQQTESETQTQKESETESEMQQTESETEQTESETQQTESETQQMESETQQTESETQEQPATQASM